MTETAHGTKGHSPVPAAQQDTATVRPADLDTLSPNSGQRNGSDERSEFERHLDGISLQRALIDFDVANARVIDLTHRYVEATEEIKRLRHDLETLRIQHGSVVAELDRTRSTKAYRIAQRIWALRRALDV